MQQLTINYWRRTLEPVFGVVALRSMHEACPGKREEVSMEPIAPDLTALTATVGSAERAARAERLAHAVVERARQDSALADALRAWRQDALDAIRTGSGEVHNEVSGGRQQTVIQARDIHGDISLGNHGG
jgi:hypothetical protein